jgi:antitoxin ParD1/3/4
MNDDRSIVNNDDEYIRGLIRDDQKRRAREKLEAALLEGLKSGSASETSPSCWADKRKYLRERHESARIVE